MPPVLDDVIMTDEVVLVVLPPLAPVPVAVVRLSSSVLLSSTEHANASAPADTNSRVHRQVFIALILQKGFNQIQSSQRPAWLAGRRW
jgi:hypothetical protein